MSLLISGGTVSTPDGMHNLDVWVQDGRIAALVEPGVHVDADEVVDAGGKLVFPGFIDPHVHSRDPGQTDKEDFAHSTQGALSGGVTTVLEMPNAIPPVSSAALFEERRIQHEQNAWVDFGLWGISIGPENLAELGPLVRAGAVAIKIFWGYALRKDTLQLVYNLKDEPAENLLAPPDNGEVLAIFTEVAAAGGLLAAHCEERHVLTASEEALGHPIETYDDLLAARPAVAESTAIAIAADFAEATGCRFHVVHMASERGASTVRSARSRGISITAETCPQYLTLTADSYDRVGPVMKVYPPVRNASDQEALWAAVADGTIESWGSDHAPHTVEQKAQGFATQPAGAVGCETFGPVLVDAMLQGRTTPERFTEVISTATAKLYGLFPRKGVIQPGSDADLTIIDPQGETKIRNENLRAKQPVSPWHGFDLRGAVECVVLRGEVAWRDGQPVGSRRGRFVPAEHSVRHDR